MNKQQIVEICRVFDLGVPLASPGKVLGGLLHHMWRLDASHGSFAIKQLSKNIILTPRVRASYEQSERVAYSINKIGIAAVSALEYSGKRLIDSDNNTFLVYPWVAANTRSQGTINKMDALKIASILATIHQTDLDIDFPEVLFNVHDEEKIGTLIDQVCLLDLSFSQKLKDNYEVIRRLNQDYQTHIPILQKGTVISHGDLDQKNVLWDENDKPILIDWESAGKLNPAQEIIDAALDWSGIISKNSDRELFIQMIQSYQNFGGYLDREMVEAAFWGVCGNWINWMVYNLQRSCKLDDNNLDQQSLGVEQVHKDFDTLIRVESLIPELTKMIINE